MNANINQEHLVAIDDDGGRQPHDSSFSSDDTEFLGLPSSRVAATTTAPLTSSQCRPSVCDAATQPDLLVMHFDPESDTKRHLASVAWQNGRLGQHFAGRHSPNDVSCR